MKLLHKFSLAFLISNFIAVLLLLALVIWSLTSGFNEFVNTSDQQYFTRVKQSLTQVYQQHQSWQPLTQDRELWRDVFAPNSDTRMPEKASQPAPRHEQRPRSGPPPREGRGDRNNRPPPREGRGDRDNRPPPREGRGDRNNRPPPREDRGDRSYRPPPREERSDRNYRPPKNEGDDFMKTERRISFYDANKVPFVGREDIDENQWIEAITFNGDTVGYLALVPANAEKNSPASIFLKQQYQMFALIALAVIFLAVLMALGLSRHLVAPIKRLIAATNGLRGGLYDTRVPVLTRDELGQLSENVNDLAQTLEKNQSNRYQWMSDTSHELRTPLTVIKSQLIAIQDGIFQADEKKIALFIEEIEKLNRLVDDLYQLSSSDIGGLTYKKTEQQPLVLLSQVVANYQGKFEQCNLSVSHNLDDPNAREYTAIVDKDRIKQLFSNLLENSCRYTDPGGKLNIVTHCAGQTLEIQIQDSAPGVTAAKRPKLFERFYRVEASRSRKYGGSGLGLALCKQIIEAHQGTITAMSSPLGGLCIKLTLPLAAR
ncbi:HAMP domain-containing protein [Thalassomonas viridans]|uniref:histidine kinase n=1 Tax=Thalassomonas viridans TaxID=137584 RepID=A0AAF0C9N6_9GAMM|nr:ATP-binding protein [Thalassomonas viridans]WDE05656.1 HAMP domain-containing protein [Thalassomonas viridans]